VASCNYGNERFGPQKLEISYPAEQLLAFQEVLFFVEFVKYFQMTPNTSPEHRIFN
jgi:hypothetical protein